MHTLLEERSLSLAALEHSLLTKGDINGALQLKQFTIHYKEKMLCNTHAHTHTGMHIHILPLSLSPSLSVNLSLI